MNDRDYGKVAATVAADHDGALAAGSIPDRIRAKIGQLSPGETKVARALLENYPELALSSAATIGQTAGTSPATVLRCISQLGFPTFPAFHAALRKELRSRLSSERFYEAPSEGTALPGPLTETELQNLTHAFSHLSPDVLHAIRQVLTLPVLWIYGGRFSYSLAHYLHAHLHLLRPRVFLLNSGSTPIAEQVVEIGRGHGLVLFDFRDYDLEALFAACYVRSRRGQVVLVTDLELSPAARYANHVLAVPVNKPLPSHTAATATIDALVLDFIQHQADTVTKQSERIADSRQLLQRLRDSEGQAGEPPDQAGRAPQFRDGSLMAGESAAEPSATEDPAALPECAFPSTGACALHAEVVFPGEWILAAVRAGSAVDPGGLRSLAKGVPGRVSGYRPAGTGSALVRVPDSLITPEFSAVLHFSRGQAALYCPGSQVTAHTAAALSALIAWTGILSPGARPVRVLWPAHSCPGGSCRRAVHGSRRPAHPGRLTAGRSGRSRAGASRGVPWLAWHAAAGSRPQVRRARAGVRVLAAAVACACLPGSGRPGSAGGLVRLWVPRTAPTGAAGGFWQDGSVGIGSQDDRRVTELVLHDLQVGPSCQCQGRRTVPQSVQGDRWQPRLGDQAAEQAGHPVRPYRFPGAASQR